MRLHLNISTSSEIGILLIYLDIVYPAGKPMIPHLRCCQGFAVAYYGFTLDAMNLGHPRLSLN